MNAPEPPRARWELRWRLAGAEFRARPLFWVSCALLGVRYYHDPEGGGAGTFAFWMAAAFVCLLLHELGHVAAARLFGARPLVVLGGLGGHTLGAEGLRLWQRAVVLLAGPAVTFLLVGALYAVTALPFPTWLLERGWGPAVANGWYVLTWCNLCWGVLNLLPLWPLDGGRLACAAAEALRGPRGLSLALVLSILVAGALTLGVLWDARRTLTNRYDPRYALYLGYYVLLLVYCFALWVSGFKALWGGPSYPRTSRAEP